MNARQWIGELDDFIRNAALSYSFFCVPSQDDIHGSIVAVAADDGVKIAYNAANSCVLLLLFTDN